MNEAITIFRAWVELADTLKSDAVRGRFYSAICHYALTGAMPELSADLNVYFLLIRPVIDKSIKRRAAQEKSAQLRAEKSLQNVCKSDEPDLQNVCKNNFANLQNQVKSPPLSSPSLPPLHPPITSPVIPTAKGKEKIEKERNFADLIPESLKSEAFQAKWREWCEFRRLRRKPVSRIAAVRQLNMLGSYDTVTAMAIIERSITNDYQGLFPLNQRPAQSAGRDTRGI